jgi:predicted transglutaminase-like protease
MTKIEFFECGHALIAVRLGIVPASVLIKYDIYKTYLEHLEKTKSEEQARKLTLKSYNIHYSTMARAIYWFEREEYKSNLTYKDLRSSLQFAANGKG